MRAFAAQLICLFVYHKDETTRHHTVGNSVMEFYLILLFGKGTVIK
jgi:hypothetical protein